MYEALKRNAGTEKYTTYPYDFSNGTKLRLDLAMYRRNRYETVIEREYAKLNVYIIKNKSLYNVDKNKSLHNIYKSI